MPLILLAVVVPATIPPDVFLDLLGYVESDNNNSAVGDRGQAVGRYQLHKNYVDECNRIVHRQDRPGMWKYSDRTIQNHAGNMVLTWMSYWVPKMEKKYHWSLTMQDKLSLHRFGPTRWCPKCNDHPVDKARWEKAKKYLQNREQKS